jgi:hypothetical protein
MPSYSTSRTLTFSRFPVSLRILPKPFRRGIAVAGAAAPGKAGLLVAARAAAVKSEREGDDDDEAKRPIERMSNTILNDFFSFSSLSLSFLISSPSRAFKVHECGRDVRSVT